MKFFGNRKNGLHLNKSVGGAKVNKPRKGARKIVMRSLIVVIILAIATGIFGLSFWHWGVGPPEQRPWRNPANPPSGVIPGNPGGDPGERPSVPQDEDQYARYDDIFTFLILGADDQGGNTDVIMAVRAVFEDGNYSLNAVSIPRDTMVNISGEVRKANAIFPSMRARYRGQPNARELAIEATILRFKDVLGFEVDFAFVVDMNAFVALIDAVGGIYFDVPIRMHYPAENINLQRGFQRLNGRQSLGVVRYRATYAAGDIRRIEVQHDFLTAAVQQILENRDEIRYRDIARIFLNYVETDLTIGQTVWFALEMLKMDAENVHFHMLPGNTNDSHRRVSYVTIWVDEWLEMVNAYLNPFSEERTLEHVSILTRDRTTRQLFVTDDNWVGNRAWGQAIAAPRPPAEPPADPPGGNEPGGNDEPDPPDDPPSEPPPDEPPPPPPPDEDPSEPQIPEIPPQIDPPSDTNDSPPDETTDD